MLPCYSVHLLLYNSTALTCDVAMSLCVSPSIQLHCFDLGCCHVTLCISFYTTPLLCLGMLPCHSVYLLLYNSTLCLGMLPCHSVYLLLYNCTALTWDVAMSLCASPSIQLHCFDLGCCHVTLCISFYTTPLL